MKIFLSVSIVFSLYSVALAMEGKEKVHKANIVLVSTPVLRLGTDPLGLQQIFGLKLGPDARLVEAVVFDDCIKDWCRSKKIKSFPRYFPLILFDRKREGDILCVRVNGELLHLTINHSHKKYSQQRSFDSVLHYALYLRSPQEVLA